MTATPSTGLAEFPLGTEVAGRHRLEERLAIGGMATVYRAYDTSARRDVALKLLHENHSTQRALFEREYRTLASLRHPRIIEVYDYGIHAERLFYTMELLGGEDLRKLSPLPYPVACAYLRDVASSLALVHARGLIHRDVSPTNVRITSNHRAKLIDFGALAPFGSQSQIIGTPSCIAPEALHGMPIDARADLYSLGAVAYFLLTGRHAHPARTLTQASASHQVSPIRPSEAQRRSSGPKTTSIPSELDELVLSLLSINPAGRPATAGFVIERLNAIANLELDRDIDVIESYFAVTSTIGRDVEIERIRGALRRCIASSAVTLFVTGAAGSGKTRMMAELTTEARIRGATVVRVDAALGRGPASLAHSLIEGLVYERPAIAIAALGERAATIAAFHPSLVDRIPNVAPAPIPEDPSEWRIRVQSAMTSWIDAVCQLSALVLAIDDLEPADELSMTLLLAIANLPRERRRMLAVTVRGDEAGDVTARLGRLLRSADMVELTPLDGAQTVALVRSLFGNAPHTMRVAEWMYGISGGSPLHTLELARHLVRDNVIRYLEGTWVLPQELSARELPPNLDRVWQGRLAELDETTREIARALSIYHRVFSREEAYVVCDAASRSDVDRALDRLVAHGALKAEKSNYRFLLAPLRHALSTELRGDERRRLQKRVAEHLLGRVPLVRRGHESAIDAGDVLTMLEAARHLRESGAVERGFTLGFEACRLLLYNASEVSAAHVPFLEDLLAAASASHRDAHSRLLPLGLLAAAGYTVERHLAERFGDEAVAACRDASGLALANRLRGSLGLPLSTALGIAVGGTRFLVGRASGRISLLELYQLFLTVVASLVGTATICRDAERAKRLTATLEPFTAFGTGNVLALFHEYCSRLTNIVESREAEALAGWHRLLKRLEQPGGMPGVPAATRDLMLGGALYALGVLENFQESGAALERIARLEHLGSKLYDLVAAQLRTQYHAQRGEMDVARQWAERVEMLAVQKGSAWQAEVWISGVFGLASYQVADPVELKRAREQTELLAKSLPTMVGPLAAVRGRYLLLRGDYRGAIDELQRMTELMPPGSMTGWAAEWGCLAEAYNVAGFPAKARKLCQRALAQIDPRCRPFVWLYGEPEVQLAIAEALLDNREFAARELDRLIQERSGTSAVASLGRLHEARARVALLEKDQLAFERHLVKTSELYRHTKAPGLLRKLERLRELGQSVLVGDTMPLPDVFALTEEERTVAGQLSSELSEYHDLRRAYRRALDLVLVHAHAVSGYLFVVDAQGNAQLAASSGSDEPPHWIVDNVQLMVRGFEDDTQTTDAVASMFVNVTLFQDPNEARTLPLIVRRDDDIVLVGAVAMLRGEEDLHVPSLAFLEQVAEAIRNVNVK